MRKEWPTVALSDTASIIVSNVDKHILPGEASVRLCNYLDVYRNRRLTASMPFAPGSATKAEIARFQLQRGDVLITKDSETPDDIGVPAVVVDELPNTLCGYHLAMIRPNCNLDSGFLGYCLQADMAKRHFLRVATGVTRFGLGIRAIASFPVPLPPLEEQATIARILDHVDTGVSAATQAIEASRKLATGLLVKIFEQLPVKTRRLRDFVTDVRYGTSQASNERLWGYPTLRIPNVIGDQLSLDDLTYVDVRKADAQRLSLRDGDLLLVRTNGNPNYVGRSAVFRRPDDRTWVYASYRLRERLSRDGTRST